MALRKIITALLISTGLLVVPFVASQFVDGWLWTGSDYVFAWVMFSLVSLALTFAVASAKSTSYKMAAGLTVVMSFLLVWVNAAVGFIGDDNPANVLYLGVILVGIVGAAFARLEASGMSKTLFGMALAQMLIPTIAYFVWSPDVVSWAPGVALVFGLNAVFAAMFIASGFLFQQADAR